MGYGFEKLSQEPKSVTNLVFGGVLTRKVIRVVEFAMSEMIWLTLGVCVSRCCFK